MTKIFRTKVLENVYNANFKFRKRSIINVIKRFQNISLPNAVFLKFVQCIYSELGHF